MQQDLFTAADGRLEVRGRVGVRFGLRGEWRLPAPLASWVYDRMATAYPAMRRKQYPDSPAEALGAGA